MCKAPPTDWSSAPDRSIVIYSIVMLPSTSVRGTNGHIPYALSIDELPVLHSDVLALVSPHDAYQPVSKMQ